MRIVAKIFLVHRSYIQISDYLCKFVIGRFIDMELDAKYNPSSVEEKWYSYWTDHKFFILSRMPGSLIP